MASEVSKARESKASPLNAVGRVPKGKRLQYDDDIVEVYNSEGKLVDSGMWDYSPYRDEDFKWNDRDGNYDLKHGYKLVVR